MASTMLSGDKRWAPTRKSGMIVLGKVPKPINLPSQRLENHGLDPNVEIVPKGTLTWGSRPTSALPNVWASSALISPNTDKSFGSPSHLKGRPTSGSGTHPSTAGSEKSHEPASNARDPNLIPSSASGSFASNQTTVVVPRPQSAETRPSSAQLSRFAEIPAETPVAWGPIRTAERVGSASSKTNEFTLTSGDFPTLGSDKNSDTQIEQGHSSHGRPGSSSGKIATHKEALKPLSTGYGNEHAYSDHGNVNSWNKDGYACVGVPPPNTNWQRDPQQEHPYTSGNKLHQHQGPWHSAPIQSSDVVWHRGGEIGGPYRSAGPPGDYPVEHYICYPQFLALGGPHRPSTDPLPKSRTGPGGYCPMNAESYHHHQLPDSYKIPSHPVSLGVYPAPVPSDGLPPASFHNHTEFGRPVKEMSDQSGAYDCTNQNANHDPEKLRVIPDGHASGMAKEHNKSVHTPETRPGQYRVLLKHHECSEGKSDVQDKMDQSVLGTLPQPGRVLSGTASREEDWRRNHRRNEKGVYVNLLPTQEASSQRANEREGRSTSRDPVIPNLLVNSSRNTDDNLMMKPENTNFCPTTKNSSLIEKLSGLNNKARSVDGYSGGDEKMKHFKAAVKTNQSTLVMSTIATFTEHVPASGAVTSVSDIGNGSTISSSDENYSSRPAEVLVFADDKSSSSVTTEKTQSQVHRKAHVMRGRTDDHTKLRSDSRSANEWIKKSSGNDVLLTENTTNITDPPALDSFSPQVTCDDTHHVATYVNSTTNVIGDKAQRDKLKGIAMRRAKELQEEEEERIREQKVNAPAKLEELNRRTLAQCSNRKNYDLPLINDVLQKQVEEPTRQQKEKVSRKLEESTRTLVHNSNQNVLPKNTSQHMHDFEAGIAAKKDTIILEAPCPNPAQSSNLLTQDPAIPNDLPLPLDTKNSAPEVVTQSTSSNHVEINASKQKHTGSRRRQNISKEEIISEKPTAMSTDSLKNPIEVAILTSSGDSLLEENSMLHRKRGSRNTRNKSRMYEAVMNSTLLTPASMKEDLDKGPTECGQEKEFLTSVSNATQDPVQTIREDVVNASSKQGQSQATDNVHAKVGSQWKSQSIKKSIKTKQVRPADKLHGSEAVVWAPVRPSNRNEPSGEASQKYNVSNGKNEHNENVMRTKRAELERYVPKPVAKELSQQNSQESVRHVDPAASCDRTSKPDSGFNDFKDGRVNMSALGKLESVDKSEFSKPSKRGKVHTSWRQRNSAESPSIQNSTKHTGKTSDQNQATINVNLPESQHDDWNSNHDNLVPTEKITLSAVIKDQRVPDRQRRQQLVVHERRHHSPIDNKDLRSGPDIKICTQSPVSELNESDRKNVSRAEGQSVGSEQMRSHWQPKSHAPCHNYIHERDEDARHYGALVPRTNGAEKKNPCLQEANRGIKVTVEQAIQQIHSANCDLPIDDELAPSGLSGQHEQPVSSEPRRHGHYNNRFSRGHTSSRGIDLGQDAVKQILDTNSDNRRDNMHLEYQPIVSNNKGDGPFRQSRMTSQGAREGPRAPGPRYRECGEPRPKHAGSQFYGERSAATVQSSDSCNIRD